MLVAAVQLCSGPDRDRNLATAGDLVAEASARGARLVVLPEMVNVLGSGQQLRDGAEPLDGPTATWAADQARHHGIWLVAGSFIERVGDDTRHNTSLLVSPWGEAVAAYRKVHLFDCDVPGAEFHESAVSAPGTEPVVGDTGELGLRVGMTICYDLRFPELYRVLALAGADLVVVPAAFTARTGPPHWEVLLRARAIENQVHVVAAGQWGSSNESLHWHGHSMIVDPWGTVLAQAPDGDAVVVADVDLDRQARRRAVLPSLSARRPEAYRWPAGG
ncbi:MAG: carbon-nitrogen hydrolase family protein [Acidimicrobiales bacterium]